MSEKHCSEEWRPVVGYEKLYSVSNLGRVRRDAPGRCIKAGTYLSSSRSSDGYLRVSLNGRVERAHRIVLVAFFGPPGHKQQCNHKNGVKDDNRIENLEWCTSQENINHAFRVLGRQSARGERNRHAKLTAKDVHEIRARRAMGERLAKIGKAFGVSEVTVLDIYSRRTWKHV